MKLESLKGFGSITKSSMKFIVGGAPCATGGGTKNLPDGSSIKYSADTVDGTSKTYHTESDKSSAPSCDLKA